MNFFMNHNVLLSVSVVDFVKKLIVRLVMGNFFMAVVSAMIVKKRNLKVFISSR